MNITESRAIQAAADVYRAVEKETGVTSWQIMGCRKTDRVTLARCMVIAALNIIRPDFSLNDLAEAVRKSSHRTAFSALKRARDMFETDQFFRDQMLRIMADLKKTDRK